MITLSFQQVWGTASENLWTYLDDKIKVPILFLLKKSKKKRIIFFSFPFFYFCLSLLPYVHSHPFPLTRIPLSLILLCTLSFPDYCSHSQQSFSLISAFIFSSTFFSFFCAVLYIFFYIISHKPSFFFSFS